MITRCYLSDQTCFVQNWAPTAVALDDVRLAGSGSFDIISTLVDIYGDALFVTEYKCAFRAI